ncbi:flavodoxin [Vibrio gallicus]|uniref:flavodoxin n=1 Tax=Vibrio gallicus TaxID=190897 RepID=UPI0021C4BDBE|nr:flavodoxin [Vibrio gallicus]
MSSEILGKKISWMTSHIEVDFPTRESVLGKAIYLDLMEASSTEALTGEIAAKTGIEWLQADFHKMTVMFADHFSNNVQLPTQSQGLLLEFLAQIILDKEASQLWLAFNDGQVVATAIVTQMDKQILISDFQLADKHKLGSLIQQIGGLHNTIWLQAVQS